MVGTRDRVPHGIGLSSEISAGILGRRGPRTRSYPLFLGIRFSRFPGRVVRPAPPLPSVRGAKRYITRTPSRGQGGIAPFSREGAPQGPVFPIRPGTTRFYRPSGRVHIPSISPGRGGGRRECDPTFRGASPQGGSPPQGDSLRPTATPLAMQRGRTTLVRPASQIDR